MGLYIDRNDDDFHFFFGGKGDDDVIGNGSSARLFGKGGDDFVTPGIVDPTGPRAIVYGDFAAADAAGVPEAVLWNGKTPNGKDWVAFGYNVEAVGDTKGVKGAADVYDMHGPAPDNAQHRAAIRALDPREGDKLLMDHSDGFMVHRVKGTRIDDHHVELESLQIRGYSTNNMVREQNVLVGFDDGVTIYFTGAEFQDDVQRWVDNAAWFL